MDTTGVIQLIVLLLLIMFSAFFSSAETAFSRITRAKLRALEEDGVRHAKTLSKIFEDYDRMITTILIGNNIVNLSASALTTVFTMRIWGNVYISIGTGILTLIVLVFGEIVPKTAARHNSEKMALSFCVPIRFLMTVLFPLVFVIDILAGAVLKIFGLKRERDEVITESELRSYVDVSHEDGVIESDERKIINNIFDFSDSVAKDIMIPRIDIMSIPEEATYKEVMKVFRETMYTRLPVYKDDNDNIIGFINVKDLIRLKDVGSFAVSKFLREGYYTYEYKKTNDLMIEMRSKSQNLAFVNDEFGNTVGMVTMEDLLEEIVGELRDEYDQDEETQIVKDGDGYLIEARMRLEDVNDVLGTEFDSEDYDTIGGLVLDSLDRIPENGETVTLEDGTTLTVKGIKSNRIVSVYVVLPGKETEEENE
ncbi:MAG: hemolysin family protein [Lachnospiraceae bacterium]|nr:hemolysin family protein [Lachnospiraceae bacterium]